MVCERCQKEHDGSFGSGRFCSKACAKANNQKEPKYCPNCGERIKERHNKYCSEKCSSEYRKKRYIDSWLSTGIVPTMEARAKSIREYILKEQNGKCAICGIEPIWNGKPLVFILDHIDGDATNNARTNLRLICPHCDSQTDTYKGRNRNSGRFVRRQRYKEGKSY